ncbi:MAG: trigger factor [Rickettsiaceae bacterium]|nr:trigger factor [Rickettsiaceae bacterium]
MSITELKKDDIEYHIKVKIPAKEVTKEVDKKLADAKGTLSIPGFRKGKVPDKVLKKKYGEATRADIVKDKIMETINKVTEEKKLRTVANPDVEDVVNEEDKDVEFTLKFELNPEIKMPNFKQIAIEKPVLNVNDKDIDAEIEKFASLSKSYDKEKKDKAKKGDQVTINAVGYINDKAFDGGKLDNHKLVLGSGSFIEGFEKQLEGTKAGDDIVVKATFPKDYHAKDLAGKPAEFKVSVVTIHSETKTKIDDEFAKKFQCENIQELKKQVKENIATEYSRHVSGLIKMKLFNKLEDMLKFNVPKSLLNKELESLKQQMSGSEEEDPSLKKKSAKEKEENYLKLATRRVRLGLLLAEYIREKNLQITQEDVKKAILDQARNFPGQEQQIIDFYTNNKNAVESLTGPMLEEKAVKEIFDKEITMTEKAYNKEELKKLLEKEELQD